MNGMILDISKLISNSNKAGSVFPSGEVQKTETDSAKSFESLIESFINDEKAVDEESILRILAEAENNGLSFDEIVKYDPSLTQFAITDEQLKAPILNDSPLLNQGTELSIIQQVYNEDNFGIKETGVYLADDATIDESLLMSGMNYQDNVEDNIKAFNNELNKLNLNSAGKLNISMKNLLASHPAALSEGRYEIAKSEISGNLLKLELNNDNNESIKISVPRSIIDWQYNSDSSDFLNKKVALDGMPGKERNLDELLLKLNLKEFELNNIEATDSNKRNTVILKIKADNENGQPVEFVKSVNRIQIRQEVTVDPFEKEVNNKASELKSGLVSKQLLNNKEIPPVNSDRTASETGAKIDNDNIWSKGKAGQDLNQKGIIVTIESKLKEDLTGQQNNLDGQKSANKFVNTAGLDNSESIFNIDRTHSVGHKVSHENIPRSARFILPDNIQNSLKPNGQSVMIRINPDHLGPARLNLSLVDDKLKARLVVHSFAAKSVLENSVDRLVEQLNKVDIKVDLIDITVSGDSSDNELAHRQSHWGRKIFTNNVNRQNFDINHRTETAQPPVRHNYGYVNAGGVNLLA